MYLRILMVTMMLVIIISACDNKNEIRNTSKESNIEINNQSNYFPKNENVNQNAHKKDHDIQESAVNFLKAGSIPDSKLFKELIGTEGIYSITYYIDEREPHRVIHVNKEEIRDDLVLANAENKAGLSVTSLFGEPLIDLEIPINTSNLLSNISFDVNWRVKDEAVIEDKLNWIADICKTIILTNNEYAPQIFALKDNFYVFTYSSIGQKPFDEFTGDWMIFELMENKYVILALMKFT